METYTCDGPVLADNNFTLISIYIKLHISLHSVLQGHFRRYFLSVIHHLNLQINTNIDLHHSDGGLNYNYPCSHMKYRCVQMWRTDLWGIWRRGPPLSPLFWSCWRRGRWPRTWPWRKPRCPGSSRAPCPRTVRRGRPGRWSARCPAPGAAPAGTCSSAPSARCDSPRLQPEKPEQERQRQDWLSCSNKHFKRNNISWNKNPQSSDSGWQKSAQIYFSEPKQLVMMWTHFPSVLLQRHRPALRVFHLEGVKVGRFSGLRQLRLQEE